MHLVARYPGTTYVGVDSVTFPSMGAKGTNMLKIRQKSRKMKALLISTYCFTVLTPYFLEMIMYIWYPHTLGTSWVG